MSVYTSRDHGCKTDTSLEGAMAKSIDEQIASLEARRKADAERLAELRRKAAARDRKARNHRLIEAAAVLEHELGFELDAEKAHAIADVVGAAMAQERTRASAAKSVPGRGLKVPPPFRVPGLTGGNGGA